MATLVRKSKKRKRITPDKTLILLEGGWMTLPGYTPLDQLKDFGVNGVCYEYQGKVIKKWVKSDLVGGIS